MDFSDELPGNSIDSLGSGYQYPILELSDCDSKVLFLVHCWGLGDKGGRIFKRLRI